MLNEIQRSYVINHSMFGSLWDCLDYSELISVVNQFQFIAQATEIMRNENPVC